MARGIWSLAALLWASSVDGKPIFPLFPLDSKLILVQAYRQPPRNWCLRRLFQKIPI